MNLNEEVARYSRPLYVESWFTADVKLGALAIHLDTPKCFAAEAYARELSLSGAWLGVWAWSVCVCVWVGGGDKGKPSTLKCFSST